MPTLKSTHSKLKAPSHVEMECYGADKEYMDLEDILASSNVVDGSDDAHLSKVKNLAKPHFWYKLKYWFITI